MFFDANHFIVFRRPESPYYYYYVYRNGRKVWRSTGEKSKSKAIGVIINRLNEGDILAESSEEELRFGEWAYNFWDYNKSPYITDRQMRGKQFSELEAKKYQTRLNKYIMPTFKNTFIYQMNRTAINSWFLSLPSKYKLSYKTCNDILSELKIMLDYAMFNEIIEVNPARQVKQFSKQTKERGCFTEVEVRAIFSQKWTSPLAYTACRLAECTGLRIGEILALKVGNVRCTENLDGLNVNYLYITSSFSPKVGLKSTKNGKNRVIKITPKIKDMLFSLPTVRDKRDDPNAFFFTMDGKNPMDRRVITDRLHKAMDDAGINWKEENLSFHSFRHFANSHYLPVLGGERTRMIIGHQSTEMTRNYLHDTFEDYDRISHLQDSLFAI